MAKFNRKKKEPAPQFEVTIEKLVFGGKSLARHEDGRVVFVVGDTLPGEKILVEQVRKKKDYIEAKVIKRLSDAPNRQKAPCPYFGVCGGCFIQNLSYEDQLSTKQGYLQEIFDKMLPKQNITLQPIIGSPQEWRYRHKILLNFFADDSDEIQLGYYHKGSWFRVIDVQDCLLFDERLGGILQTVRDWANEHELPIFHHRKYTGLLRNITLRHSQAYDEWLAAIVTTDQEFDQAIFTDLIERLQQLVNLKSFYWRMVPVQRKKGETQYDTHIWGEEYITEQLADLDFEVRYGDFFQNNVRQATQMVNYVLDAIDATPESKILDLYCGVGTFTLPLAKKFGVGVFGVEIVQTAIDSAQKNATKNGITDINFLCKDVSKVIDEVLADAAYDVIVVDPPRAGIDAKVIQGLLQSNAEQIIYISCNPTTLARDLMGLGLKYDVVSVQPFDLFPQTYHAECIAVLKKSPVK